MTEKVSIKTQFHLTKLIHRIKGMNGYDRATLLEIADFVNHKTNWECYPSQKTLAERTGFSLRQTSTSVGRLRDEGLIEYHKGTNGLCNKYKIVVDVVGKLVGVDACYSTVDEKPKEKYIYNDGEDDEDAYPPF